MTDKALTQSSIPMEMVAVMLAATGQTTIPRNGYDMMAAVDAQGRSANALQHQFRAVLKRAKEIRSEFETVGAKTVKTSGNETKKRGRAAQDDETGEKRTRGKKIKQEVKEEECSSVDEDAEDD